MRLNPLPFVFAPGVALGGYFLGGLTGAGLALAIWILVVALGTLCAWLLHRR